MIVRALAATLLLLVSVVAAAEEMASRESVERLIELTEAPKMIDAIHGQVGQMFEGFGQQMNLVEEDQAAFDRYMQQVADLMREEVSWEALKEPTIDIYVRNFSQTEVQGLIDFYSSEIGQSMVRKMPAVMQESMLLSQDILKTTMP